jgi:hypothetical protein
MGFGVLVKIFAMVKASEEACAAQTTDPTTPANTATGDETTPTCTPLTVDQLVNEFQSGAGMGALFKEYGKPALLGVGQVRKELKKQATTNDNETVEPAPGATVSDQTNPDKNNGQDKSKDKPKDKGKDKGNGNPNH